MATNRLAAGTPVEETLDVLQRRLNQAEIGASKLTKHLHKYGYKSTTNDGESKPRIKKSERTSEASKTGKSRTRENVQLQKSFEDMENRMSKMENTLHSLNTGMSGIKEDRFISKAKYEKEIAELRDKYLKELKNLEEKLQESNNDADELKRRDKEMQDELEHVIKNMRENQDISSEKDMKIGELEEKNERISKQKNEVELQLQREVALRRSLEDAHEALLMRIQDMEVVVDSERGQVNDLVSNWDSAKQEAIATREAFENEHELRVQLEGTVSQQEQDIALLNDKLKRTLEEKKQIEHDLSKLSNENKTLRQQNGLTTTAHDKLKAAYESLVKDNQKLHEALKIAATDNKALIAQHKESVQREKERVSQQLHMQDKLLDNAKEAVLKELEREKTTVRNIENENTDLKTQLKSLKASIAEKENRIGEMDQKYEIDKAQLNALTEALRKDKEMIVLQKNDKIFELQNLLEELKNERVDDQVKIRELKLEIERVEKVAKNDKVELEQALNKLNSAEQNILSQKQIESAFGEIMKSKQKLAYENGLLQSKVDQMVRNMKEHDHMRIDYGSLKKKHDALSKHYDVALEDIKRLKSECSDRGVEVQQLKSKTEKQDKELQLIAKTKEEAYREIKRVASKSDLMVEKYSAKITVIENKLKIAEDDNKKLAESFEAVMTSHSKLEAALEESQIMLGKKDNEILSLTEERNATQRNVKDLQIEMDNLQKKISSLKDIDSDELSAAKEANQIAESKNRELAGKIHRLERENKLLQNEIETLKNDIKKKVKQMEEDVKEREIKEKEIFAKASKEKEEIEENYKQHIEKLNAHLGSAEKTVSNADAEAANTARKMKKLKDECNRLRKELEESRDQNKDKSRQISEMAVNIEELKFEVENAAYLQTQADISTRQFEDEIEKEKFTRIEAESKYLSLRNKEKALERKLKKATQQNAKATHEYKQAQVWFHRKVQELEAELESARQTQLLLEQTNLEQEKLLESRTEDAKNAVRSSRLAVSKLKSEVAESLWETRSLKHVVQSEQDNATIATLKYERLMESSARKVEELAKELDRAHEKARKAR